MSRIFDIDTNLWRTFKSVSETRSITRSAVILCKTPPAISMQIKKLEALLELKLFVRGDDGFRLTLIGEEVLAAAEKILAMHDNLFRLKNKNPDSELRLGMPDDYALFFLHSIVKSLTRSDPALKIKLVCKTSLLLIEDMKLGRLDLAVVAVPESQVIEHSEHIRHETLHWIGDAELVMAGYPIPLVHFPEGCICREVCVKSLELAQMASEIRFTSESNFAVFNAIGAGVGIGVGELSLIPADTPIIRSSLLPPLPAIKMCVLSSNDRISRSVLARISTSVALSVNSVCETNIIGNIHPKNAFAVGAF
ncbi:LysR family transcriptional regulator [Pseudomonas syringae]|uniref:LysR family transcriptional regulator n=1 Tax=Pseudomonas syringae TaxID=317 RepID=A0A244EQ06_PSESX|nr:LysR family transcriptional regulator [Pseudomonas syringae]MCI3944931.1 LysR family transcriptional regulator [Pseudomonas syringae]OUM06595.1 LysR family transcriptional regulator [Pseudomonas syringae]